MSVYFAQVGPYIKVGYSTDPARRVRRMFKGATEGPLGVPRDLASRHLLRAIPGTKEDERRCHDALTDFCVTTEWFLDEPEVRAFVETVEPGHYPNVTRPAGKYQEPTRESPELLEAFAAMLGDTPEARRVDARMAYAEAHPRAQAWEIREWAVKEGRSVRERGPLSSNVVAAYLAAHPDRRPPVTPAQIRQACRMEAPR